MTYDLERGLHMRIKRPPRRMTLTEWLGDALDAGKCGEAGIPMAGDVPPTPTGRQSEIARTADNQIAMLRRRAQMQTRPMEAQLANLSERIGQLQPKIDELSAQEAEILGRPVYRLPAEAGAPDEVVAGRRAADNRKEAAPIRQSHTRTTGPASCWCAASSSRAYSLSVKPLRFSPRGLRRACTR
jgi:hypothetical protein